MLTVSGFSQRNKVASNCFVSRVAWQFRYWEYPTQAFETGKMMAATGLNFYNACSGQHGGYIVRRYLP